MMKMGKMEERNFRKMMTKLGKRIILTILILRIKGTGAHTSDIEEDIKPGQEDISKK